MSMIRTTASLACIALLLSAGAAFAQAGGSDVPGNAKAAGTMQNGSSSTGMSKGKAMKKMNKGGMMGGSMKGGSMKKM